MGVIRFLCVSPGSSTVQLHDSLGSGKEELHNFCRSTKRDSGGSYFERYYRNDSSPCFHEIKMNRHAFVGINRMRADHCSLKTSLSRFNFVPTAECESGEGLQREEHIFSGILNCMRTRGQQWWTLSENSKKQYPVTELLGLEEKWFVQGVCYFINKIPKFIKTKEVNVKKY
jgi:hypothetical protein